MALRVRALRSTLLLAMGSLVAMAAVNAVGCGGDDSTAATADDAASEATVDNDSSVIGDTVDVIAKDVQVYVGTLARLDASQSKRPAGQQLTFDWVVKSAPPGSAVTNASIVGASSETPSFVTDVAGDYVLTATATAGNVHGSKDVKVTALNAPVFYLQVNPNDNPISQQTMTALADGTGKHSLNCRQPLLPQSVGAGVSEAGVADGGDGGLGQQFGNYMIGQMMNFIAGPFIDVALDSYEMPPGTPSRAAFSDWSTVGDASVTALVAATTDNTCQSPPVRLHVITPTGKDPLVIQPRFSPNGSRVAFLEDRGRPEDAGGHFEQADVHLAVVGFDGTDYHDIGPYCESGEKSCWFSHMFPRRPQWLDDTHVGWIRLVPGSQQQNPVTWQIVVAPDLAGAAPTPYMTCPAWNTPFSFAFLPNGDVLANYQPTKDSAENLVIFGRDGAGNCVPKRNLTGLLLKNSYARDFAVSPDGSLVAYMQMIGDPDAGDKNLLANCAADAGPCLGFDIKSSGGGSLYVVPVEGTEAPHPVSGKELKAIFGPRFISGGTRLAWNGYAPFPSNFDASTPLTSDGGLSLGDAASIPDGFGLQAVNVIPIDDDGGHLVHVAVADLTTGEIPLGGGNGGGCDCQPVCAAQCFPKGCAMAGRYSPELAMSVSGFIGLVFAARRRGRKNRKKS